MMNLPVAIRVVPGLLLSLLLAFVPHDGDGGGKDIGNASPPGIGGDGPWSSLNMQLLGRLTLTELGSGGAANVLGNDCWGWTDPLDGKEYAICGLTNRTSFVDISDPSSPKYLGNLPTQTGNSAWRDMKVCNNHVYVVSDNNGSHGMQVFDLTNLRGVDPANPQNFANTAWYGGFTEAHNIAINEDSGFAYIVGSDQASGGLHVVDIRDPANPVFAGNFGDDGYTHDVQVVNYHGPDPDHAGREIAFCSNEDTVTLVDVTDKGNMTMISRNSYGQTAYTHQGWLSEDHRYFYMGDELDESSFGGPTRMHIFDCLDLDNPVYKGYFSGNTYAIDHNLYVNNGRIYSGSYSAGLRVLQPGVDPSQLSEVAFFDTYNTNTGVNFDGVWSVFPFYASGVVLINDRQNGMFLVKLTPISFSYPGQRPEMIHSGGAAEFQVEANAFAGTPQPGTGFLHVDRGNGFETFPMNQLSPNVYEAVFPSTNCGSEVRYYVSAMAGDGSTVCSPNNAPAEYWTAISGYGFTVTFADDFEANNGWGVSGDAVDGQWVRGVPAGGGLRADPPLDADGSGKCFLTDNVAGNSDVDDGSTILTSPLLDATGAGAMDAVLSYYRWYSNDLGGSPNEDVFVVDISNDDGETWKNLETVGPTGREISGGWHKKSFVIGEHVVPTSQMRVRFNAADLGGGSVVEAGVDGVRIQLIDCLDVVVPEGYKRFDGLLANGTLSDVFASDNSYLSFLPQPTSNLSKQIVELYFQSELPGLDPSEFRVKLEARMVGGPAGDVIQEVFLFNRFTSGYELIDVRPALTVDNLVDIPLSGDLSRFILPNGEITARVKWTSPGFAGTPFNWTIDIDQLVWAYRQTPQGFSRFGAGKELPDNPGKTIRKKRGSR